MNPESLRAIIDLAARNLSCGNTPAEMALDDARSLAEDGLPASAAYRALYSLCLSVGSEHDDYIAGSDALSQYGYVS